MPPVILLQFLNNMTQNCTPLSFGISVKPIFTCISNTSSHDGNISAVELNIFFKVMYIFQDLYPNDKEIECKSREVVFVLETIIYYTTKMTILLKNINIPEKKSQKEIDIHCSTGTDCC